MIFGKRVVLGPIMPPDLTSLFQWTDSAEDAAINGTYRPPSWNEQEEFWLLQQDPSRIFFAIRIKPRSEIAGYIQIREIEPVHRSAKIGIWIGEAAERGKGIAWIYPFAIAGAIYAALVAGWQFGPLTVDAKSDILYVGWRVLGVLTVLQTAWMIIKASKRYRGYTA
ncbi:GNAT family N-acetyltransferase [uncultured Sphingopyxis sp.]|uniref:GNAT family N-acetyltransferase n=1 Tax=uncultured Sphingopyxis sp. TaxID=310581 RepID=UPI0025918E37|nr:GNAT family N-acetyltransferase [uncultured Sphingopyxis sp.]